MALAASSMLGLFITNCDDFMTFMTVLATSSAHFA